MRASVAIAVAALALAALAMGEAGRPLRWQQQRSSEAASAQVAHAGTAPHDPNAGADDEAMQRPPPPYAPLSAAPAAHFVPDPLVVDGLVAGIPRAPEPKDAAALTREKLLAQRLRLEARSEEGEENDAAAEQPLRRVAAPPAPRTLAYEEAQAPPPAHEAASRAPQHAGLQREPEVQRLPAVAPDGSPLAGSAVFAGEGQWGALRGEEELAVERALAAESGGAALLAQQQQPQQQQQQVLDFASDDGEEQAPAPAVRRAAYQQYPQQQQQQGEQEEAEREAPPSHGLFRPRGQAEIARDVQAEQLRVAERRGSRAAQLMDDDMRRVGRGGQAEQQAAPARRPSWRQWVSQRGAAGDEEEEEEVRGRGRARRGDDDEEQQQQQQQQQQGGGAFVDHGVGRGGDEAAIRAPRAMQYQRVEAPPFEGPRFEQSPPLEQADGERRAIFGAYAAERAREAQRLGGDGEAQPSPFSFLEVERLAPDTPGTFVMRPNYDELPLYILPKQSRNPFDPLNRQPGRPFPEMPTMNYGTNTPFLAEAAIGLIPTERDLRLGGSPQTRQPGDNPAAGAPMFREKFPVAKRFRFRSGAATPRGDGTGAAPVQPRRSFTSMQSSPNHDPIFVMPIKRGNPFDPFNNTPGIQFPGGPGSPFNGRPFMAQTGVGVVPERQAAEHDFETQVQ